MSVVVMAYHEMGCLGLNVLIERGVNVSAVFTYHDNPAENCWFGSVAGLAQAHGIPTFVTTRVNNPEWVERMRSLAPDVIFSFYYRDLLKQPILQVPRYACVNLHGSLLPRYRGRCPVNWQVLHGETESGVTLHYISARADAGDIIGQERVPVGPDDTALDLYMKLLPAARQVLLRHLDGILTGTAPRTAQDHSMATTFNGRRPEDGRIDWRRSARKIHDLVRAVAPPWPCAFSDVEAGRVVIARSKPHADVAGAPSMSPGEVWRDGERIFVQSGAGLLELLDYTLPHRSALETGEILGTRRDLEQGE